MGRTAAAFLVLVALGGCVADDQGPMVVYPAAKPGQAGVTPGYASWSRPDQFAAMQDEAPVTAKTVAAAPAPTAPKATTVVQKPPAHKPAFVTTSGAATQDPAPPAPADVVVDAELVNATLVTLAGDKADPAAKKEKADAGKEKDKGEVEKAKNDAEKPHAPPALNLAQPAGDPAAPAIRMVNSKRVTLNYELKDVGASGVSGVELWCTQDGHTWKKGEIVAQTSHSFTVEVKEEGLYGFTLLARNGAGVGKDAPAAGEQPQVWVTVDVTKPAVQIVSVELDRNAKTPTVEVHWVAKDKNLGPKPITLSYAEQPEGPWTPIAAGVENSGQYEWQPKPDVPHRIYLKVEAVDMPGNAAAAQTANPLKLESTAVVAAPAADANHKTLPAPPAIDASRPTAAILGVEPNGN